MDSQPTRQLYRSRTDRVIFGVCGGLGQYFGIDSLIFRILFILLTLGGGAGAVIYLIMAIVVPTEPIEGSQSSSHGDAKDRLNQFAQEMRQNAQNLAQEIKQNRHSHPHARGSIFGLIVILIGLAFLAENLFPQPWFRWDIFWPVIVILFGVMIMARRR